MKKIRSKKIAIIFIVILIIVSLCGTVLIYNRCTREERRHEIARDSIKELTFIKVPIESKILFYYLQNTGFANGRPEQLTVFQFDSEPTDWLKQNKFLRSDDETLVDDEGDSLIGENEWYFLSHFKNETKNGQKVPEEYVPNFEENYQWLRTKRVHFFYYPDTLRLIVYIAWS